MAHSESIIDMYNFEDYKFLFLETSFFEVLQGVPTSLGYDKCNVLKLRKVCEQSELRLQKGPINGGNW